jgi:hypothetical protein
MNRNLTKTVTPSLQLNDRSRRTPDQPECDGNARVREADARKPGHHPQPVDSQFPKAPSHELNPK